MQTLYSRIRGWGLLVLAAGLGTGLRAADPLAARVVLLANRDDPGSVEIARHYAEVRGVPAGNIFALSMPAAETITWDEFVGRIWRPLQDELVRRKWIDAISMDLTDEVGRRKQAIAGHRIAFLVVCRGVPLRIAHDSARCQPTRGLPDQPSFQTNQAAVDSELSLLAVNESAINGFVPNPLFRRERPAPGESARVVKVSRLDGPTAADAAALVDRAVAAERTGLAGRAYVDQAGGRPEGDEWLRVVAGEARALGLDTDVEVTPETYGAGARFDAPALYFGWYTPHLNGPFALPGFMFPPGAIAVHIHSFSAETLRSGETGWCGPLLARGVTATVGNVFEPYLQLLHRPDLLLRALARGERFGDAAYYALPVLSWQSIAIGDPLYRPFAVSVADQWSHRARLPATLRPYVVLRRAHELERANQPVAARALRETELEAHPSLPLALAVAADRELAGDRAGAVGALKRVEPADQWPADEWGAVHEAAARSMRDGAPALAVTFFAQLLDPDAPLPVDLRQVWLAEAVAAAQAAGDETRGAAWSRELDALQLGAKK
ncbi:MAG: TIGR03790 family protein [Verrucomicrobia bacterium]|nr:TIGR03790 family protein [Verrucomicrobiota bacterium]